MSYWSTIYVGNAARIGAALDANEDVEDAPFVLGSVELSGIHELHCEELMQLLGDASLTFDAMVDAQLGDGDEGWTAWRMKPAFAALFAGQANDRIAAVVPRWLANLGGAYDAPAAIASLQQLAALCRTVQQQRADVVFASFT